ncbi:radial spoke head 14 homolog [Neosynchiropus ocellatus]
MSGVVADPTRAPVAFGHLGVPLLFEELRRPETDRKLLALASLCDLMHNPERLYQTVNGGFLERLEILLRDEHPSVRTMTCELLHLTTTHSIGRQALLSSSLLPPLSVLLDDPSPSCRLKVHQVLNSLALLPSGARALLSLVPKLMLKLKEKGENEEEEDVQVLLLSTISRCSMLDPGPALCSEGVPVVGGKLSHQCLHIRREAASAMMAFSVSMDGKQQICNMAVLPVLVGLLQDGDIEVRKYTAGAIMNTVIITIGKYQCLDLDILPVLLTLVCEQKQEEDEELRRRRKALVIYCLRTLTTLAEAPIGRRLLLEQLPRLEMRSNLTEKDADIRDAAQTAIRVITWTP